MYLRQVVIKYSLPQLLHVCEQQNADSSKLLSSASPKYLWSEHHLSLHAHSRKIMSDSEERSRKRRKTAVEETPNTNENLPHTLTSTISPPPLHRDRKHDSPKPQPAKVIKSPFQLTWIRDLPESSNVDAVSLRDILGDPLIAECWEFNYLHDLDFLMEQFDPDVKDLVKVHVVHGFWKREDQSGMSIKVGHCLLEFSCFLLVGLSNFPPTFSQNPERAI